MQDVDNPKIMSPIWVEARMPRILMLFDIDATLLWTGGAGRAALKVAFKRVFGDEAARLLETYDPHGRTIREIVEGVLQKANVPQSVVDARFDEFDRVMIEEFRNSIQAGKFKVEACPGAPAIVDACIQSPDVLVGLLTGNPHSTAMVKLEAAGYDTTAFKVQAFGDESPVRADLVHLARKRAYDTYGDRFEGHRTVILGDSTRDVGCALAADALCIAVATGSSSMDVLRSHSAHYVFPDLTDTQAVLGTIEQVIVRATV